MIHRFINQAKGESCVVLDLFYEEGTEVIFSYLPVWEMFFSMHVLSKPEHHISRKNWVEATEKRVPELVERIKELGELTDSWNLVIDSDRWGEVRQMEIREMISYFRRKNIYQWNEWIRYTGRTMAAGERDAVLEVAAQYYHTVFRREEAALRAYIGRVLQEEKDRCQEEGLWAWCKKIHPRLRVEEDAVVFLKNHEFRMEKNEIARVYATVSTFVDPHLWMYHHHGELEIVKSVLVEQVKNEVPEDLVCIFKGLGDPTRLKIIKYLLHGVCTTQALARELMLSEPAISKHLKILQKAGLVDKTKKGFYMEYRFKTERVDFIPYAFYEAMMQKQ